MSEIMRPMPLHQLLRWAMEEYRREGQVFGIAQEKFYRNESEHSLSFFGEVMDSAVGPAAGPNTQLAQNIIAAYVAGSRFMELKTVQKMDGAELRACVPRPCIQAQDEGYNVEWSTELTVPQAFAEYVKAWIAIHVLCKEFEISDKPNCIFNMSVGYDLEGIKGEKIDTYLEGMKDASGTQVWQESLVWLREHKSLFQKLSDADIDAIPAKVSGSVTLSTLHGCPPQEIERIAKYLLEEKSVHTFVKCNPTLLGYEKARALLDAMGFTYVAFDDHHFKDDLQFGDAVQMLGRLMAYAKERELQFGVKITNTFPVQIQRKELPGEEMYMSGRALFPLSIHVASLLSTAFEGKLPISYSGGADAFNIADIFRLGIRPITVATTILKPGGYERIKQLAEMLEPLMAQPSDTIDAPALSAYADSLPQMPMYKKESSPAVSRKTDIELGLFDCFIAPCRDGGCPIGQQIPAYLQLVAEEKYAEAFRIISIDNAAPSITGTLCNHACQSKCTRMDYETPLAIRNAKLLASNAAQDQYMAAITAPKLKTDKRVAVIGAGPAGVAAALYLRRNGVAVTVFEKRKKPFGIVEYVIPAFRIAPETIERDYQMALKQGVEFRFGQEAPPVQDLKAAYDSVVIAVGAWKPCAPVVQDGSDNMLDALAFLEESKAKACKIELGKQVAVIGGGDVAMDCARAAKRAPGVASVTLVYRRTRDFMPAEAEEIRLAIEDSVEIRELLAPLSYQGGILKCEKMTLGEWDAGGRRAVLGTGETAELMFDTVINATGAGVEAALFADAGISLDRRNRPTLDNGLQSELQDVYVAGDCKAGPSTVVSALADAKQITMAILEKLELSHDFVHSIPACDIGTLCARKGVLTQPTKTLEDGNRCLHCDTLCELCVDVCPNRANVAINKLTGFANSTQILHVDYLCNECGNCGVFCPHAGDPYKDKLTLFGSEEDFEDSENRGFLFAGEQQVKIRDESGAIALKNIGELPDAWRAVILAVQKEHAYLIG